MFLSGLGLHLSADGGRFLKTFVHESGRKSTHTFTTMPRFKRELKGGGGGGRAREAAAASLSVYSSSEEEEEEASSSLSMV